MPDVAEGVASPNSGTIAALPRASGLDGALGDIQDAGRLGDAEPVHVDQDQGHPLTLRQLLQRRLDVEPDVDAVVVVVGVSQDAEVGVGQMHDGLDPAQPVQAGVDHDPMQPGRDGGFAPEGVGAPEGRDEGFLHGVGGHLPVSGGPQCQCPHPIAVAPEELAESIRVAGAVRREQLAVGQLEQVVQARHQRALS
jgi:hypothetical protein